MTKVKQSGLPELWGGIECTINRKQDNYKDQLQLSGHYSRQGDLETIAALGIQALRYPVLWEKHSSASNESNSQWEWTTAQLNFLRTKNIQPIVGLVHHGSGPAYTSLLDPNFPSLMADYAGEVAKRFPWVEHYTPVNEPLTTARFSGLYGLWYPHQKNENAFLVMLLNQVEAIVRSMEAIRKINQVAKLVQTEDLGFIHSTPKMKYQADFENQRRWLSYDLLCGKVTQDHPLFRYFIDNGISKKRLDFFVANPCVPDIAGFNYYVTSERYLDQRLQKYPSYLYGDNGRERYVDTEAARHLRIAGIGKLLTQAWNRYRIPIAVTEAHLHCNREDQLRWFKETWDSCCRLNKRGIPVKAVTAWALLGAFDWDSLLVKDEGNYQVGVYDISGNALRPTAMVNMLQSLGKTGEFTHPLLQNKGWWHRHNPACKNSSKTNSNHKTRPLLIIGKNGSLGIAFKNICEHRGICYAALSRKDIDITDSECISRVFEDYQPWCVVNATGYVAVDDAEQYIHSCFRVNAVAPGLLAKACRKAGILFMTFSSDMVFSGDKLSPYKETDAIGPLNMIGKSKAEGEAAVIAANPSALIIRTSSFFGPWDRGNFAYKVLHTLNERPCCHAVTDVMISATYLPDLVNASLDLVIDGASGIWHLSNDGPVSWAGFAQEIAGKMGHSKSKIIGSSAKEMGWIAKRPSYSVLESDRGVKMPFLLDAIDRYFIEKVV